MKKKFMLCVAALFAAATLTLSSCGNPADKAVSLFKDATEQVKNAKSIDELKNIEKDLEAKLEKLEESNKDFEPDDKQQEAVDDAKKSFQKAWRQAQKELR